MLKIKEYIYQEDKIILHLCFLTLSLEVSTEKIYRTVKKKGKMQDYVVSFLFWMQVLGIVAQPGLELMVCLHLSSAGITGMSHHAPLMCGVFDRVQLVIENSIINFMEDFLFL
jgi:hypothetical protein